ncbi:MAG: FkbM family methyltransferase [Pseudomonadota bacterium]
MKNLMQRGLRSVAHTLIPPRILKHQIAHRNWRRGEREIKFLHELVDPARTAVDVGAYMGAYTYFLAKLATHVHAFEPQVSCQEFLSRAYPEKVTVHRSAVSNFNGEMGMQNAHYDSQNQGARLHSQENLPADSASPASLFEVTVTRLDDVDLGTVGFIKIDAEGEESNVLEGAETLVETNKPVLLIEIEQRHREQDIYEVFKKIESIGYNGQFILDGERRSLRTFSVEHHQFARLKGDKTQPYINNFIFEPKR